MSLLRNGGKLKIIVSVWRKIYKTEIRLDLTVPEKQLNTFRFYISDNDDSSSSDENSDDEILVQPQALELQITTSPR